MPKIVYGNQVIELKIYPLDTKLTIQNRITWIIQSLPKFVYISDIYAETITPINLWMLAFEEKNLIKLINNYKNYFPIEVICDIWMVYHQHEVTGYFEMYTEDYYNIDITSFKNRDIESIVNQLNKQRDEFNVQQHQIYSCVYEIDQIKQMPTTDLVIDRIQSKRVFSYEYDLVNLFDTLVVSDAFPFMTFNNIYKVLDTFEVPLNWESRDSVILIMNKVNNEFNEILIKHEENDKFAIYSYTHEENMNILSAELLNKVIFEETVIDNLGASFGIEISLNNQIFGMMLMNLTWLDYFLSFNDNIKYTDTTSRNLYFSHYFDSKIKITSSISQRIATHQDIFPVNTHYTFIKILKASTIKDIELFRQIISKCCVLYNQNEQNFINYIQYLNIRVVENTNDNKNASHDDLFLRQIDPIVFEHYTRKCQPTERYPTIIQPHEINEKESQGYQVLKFPKDEVLTKQRYYICTDPVYKHIGLVKNELTKIGYQPCCFKTEQLNKPTIKKYYSDYTEDKDEKEFKQIYLKKTDKLINADLLGLFPSSLDFTECFQNVEGQFVIRRGVQKGLNSVLECVLTALYGYKGQTLPSLNDRKYWIERQRDRLFDTVLPSVCIQDMPGMTEDEIKREILNKNIYLDPLKVRRLLELNFSCNILYFVKNSEFPNGTIISGNHVQGYVEFERNDSLPNIFIYIHQGAPSENVLFPQCELIVHVDNIDTAKNELDKSSYIFENSFSVTKFCWNIYKQLVRTNYGGTIQQPIPELPFQIQRQGVDTWGKVRMLEIIYNKQLILVETSPLPPMNLPTFNTIYMHDTINLQTARTFIKEFCTLSSIFEYVISNEVVYIQGYTSYNVYLKIYLKRDLINSDSSALHSYIHLDKISRGLTNWFCYLFSEYMYAYSVTNVTSDTMKNFIKTSIIINNEVDYGQIGPYFTVESGKGILNGGKLVVSKQCLMYLLFQLRCRIERQYDEIINFRNKKALDNYFNSVWDYTSRQRQLLFYYTRDTYGMSLVDFMKYKRANICYSFSTIDFTDNQIFIKDNDNNLFLVQKVKDIEQALTVGVTWRQSGINTVDEQLQLIQYPSYIAYLSTNENVDKVLVNNDDDELQIIPSILVNKHENDINIGSMLSLY